MNSLDLVDMAQELLSIHQTFRNHLDKPYNHCEADFGLETFTQVWGNTSGGFEGVGGSAMTSQRTYVFIPYVDGEDCQIYFGGIFAYKVPYNDKIKEDIRKRDIKGLHHKKYYFED